MHTEGPVSACNHIALFDVLTIIDKWFTLEKLGTGKIKTKENYQTKHTKTGILSHNIDLVS